MRCLFASMPSKLCSASPFECLTSAPASKEQKNLAVTASTVGRKRLALGLNAAGKCAQVHQLLKHLEAVKDAQLWKLSY